MGALAEKRQEVAILQLRRELDEELSHLLLGQALKRIKKFSETYDSDGDSLIHMREVEKDFAKDREREFLVIIAVNADLRVIGHLLAHAAWYYGNLYLYVEQFELDQGISIEKEKQAVAWMKDWQKEIGARGIRAMAPSAVHVRRLRMLHGFDSVFTSMKMRE